MSFYMFYYLLYQTVLALPSSQFCNWGIVLLFCQVTSPVLQFYTALLDRCRPLLDHYYIFQFCH